MSGCFAFCIILMLTSDVLDLVSPRAGQTPRLAEPALTWLSETLFLARARKMLVDLRYHCVYMNTAVKHAKSYFSAHRNPCAESDACKRCRIEWPHVALWSGSQKQAPIAGAYNDCVLIVHGHTFRQCNLHSRSYLKSILGGTFCILYHTFRAILIRLFAF